MGEQFSRIWVVVERILKSLARTRLSGAALKNTVWVIASLVLVWVIMGAPSLVRMTLVWQITEAMFSPPETLTQIAEPGAVVIMADTDYVAERYIRRKRGHYERQSFTGHFRAGQHLCPSLVTWGDGGKLTFDFPGGYIADIGNDPGAFRPDTSANGCSRIPQVVRRPDPNGRAESASQQFAALMAANWEELATRAFVALYAMALSFSFWLRMQGYRPQKPLQLAAMQKVYAGFAIRAGDLEYSGKKLYRVNSDGFRVNLKKWHFSDQSGEFFRVTNTIGKNVVFNTTPYSKRFVKNAKSVWKKAGIWSVAVLAALVSLGLGDMAFNYHGSVAGGYFALICAMALSIFALIKIVPLITNQDLRAIGPEPLPRAVPEFGHQQPHGSSADEGTI